MLHLLTLLLTPTLSASLPPEPPALLLLEDHGDHHGRRDRDDDRDDRHGRGRKGQERRWREDARRDRREENNYWKHERKWRKHEYHQGDRRPAPPWMNTWWRPGERRYCAVVPGDPSRVYVFVGGRWVLRHVYDPRFRADVSGAFGLPAAPPPPVPLPRVGLNLHIVLFN